MIDGAVRDGVLYLTLNRPDKHNALTLAMRQQLEALPDRLDRDPAVRCVVVTGAGSSFCAGADLTEIAESADIPGTNPAAGLAAVACPVIIAVNGLCVTGGLELALAGDIIVAAESARFCDTHAKMNVLPRWGMAARLPRRIGPGRALEMSLSSRWVQSDEAERIGLADIVVADDDLTDRATEIAQAVAGVEPAVAEAMTVLYRGAVDGTIDDALAAERQAWDI